MKYLILTLLLFSCAPTPEQQLPPYPGHQHSYQECHNVYDLHYPLNVAKCEHDLENPKFKRGQTVHFRRNNHYDKSCKAIIIAAYRWEPSPKDETIYSAKVYCGKTPMHDDWCEKGNTLNCPDFEESELKK